MDTLEQELTLRPHQRADQSWCVEAIWHKGPTKLIGWFESQSEAKDWIIYRSGAYFDGLESMKGHRAPAP